MMFSGAAITMGIRNQTRRWKRSADHARPKPPQMNLSGRDLIGSQTKDVRADHQPMSGVWTDGITENDMNGSRNELQHVDACGETMPRLMQRNKDM